MQIYAIAFKDEEFELVFDIDYITKWIDPNNDKGYFRFWVAPATLVFSNVHSVGIDLDSVNFQIEDIRKSNPTKPINSDSVGDKLEYDWVIETTNGQINFKSIGYKQYFRMSPILLETQKIDLKVRGGISFETIPPQVK